MPRQRRRHIAIGLLAGAAGLAALAGALYGLFGPLVNEGGRQTTSYYEYEDGLSTQAWGVFIGYIVGAIGTALAGGMLVLGVLRSTARPLLVFSSTGLGVLAGFTVLGVGWLVLPGASLAVVAMLLYVFGDGGE
jgi:hypothetical protein